MNRLNEKYQKEIVPMMQQQFAIKNRLASPRLTKIVINVGAGDAKDNQATTDKLVENLGVLSGQKPIITRAKSAISGFKLSKGQPIGMMVTLRGNRMYSFLDKLIGIVLPKVRDFRGLSDKSFDNQGNFTLGLREQAIFPEVPYQGASAGKVRGLEISIVTTAMNREQGKRLLELLGVPFKKEFARNG